MDNEDTVDLSIPLEQLQTAYTCAKCCKDLDAIVLLKTCYHWFCTSCIVIHGTQRCPICNMVYHPNDVCREDSKISALLQSVKRIQELQADIVLDVNNFSSKSNDILKQFLSPEDTTNVNCDIVEETNTQNECRTISSDILTCFLDELGVGELTQVKFLKAKVKRNCKGESDLHLECKKGNLKKVTDLLANGDDVNCTDWANWSPLHEAVVNQHVDCAKVILKAGALPNIPAMQYITPLHEAATQKSTELIHLLLRYGADYNAIDLHGNTPKAIYPGMPLVAESTEPFFLERTLAFDCCAHTHEMERKANMKSLLLQKVTVSNNMEYLPLSLDKTAAIKKLICPQVLGALLKAVPIIYEEDVAKFLNTTSLNFVELIPAPLSAGYKKSLSNRLKHLPKLFDGVNIHITKRPGKLYTKYGEFSAQDLNELASIAGATVLMRAPSEATAGIANTHPYHFKNAGLISNCANYIIFDERHIPSPCYKMKEMHHVSASWFVECILNTQIFPVNTNER